MPSCSRPGKKTSLSAHVPARAATASDPPNVDRTSTSDCRRFIPHEQGRSEKKPPGEQQWGREAEAWCGEVRV